MSTADKTLRLDRTQLNQRRPDPRSRNMILAVVAGLLAAMLAYWVIYNAPVSAKTTGPNNQPPPPEMVNVVVASVDIQPGVEVKSNMVKMKPIAKSEVPSNAVTVPADVVGKMSTDVIAADQPVVSDRVTIRSKAVKLSAGIPIGMRAITIPVDSNAGVGGWLKPGDHVDILATFDKDGHPMTRLVLQDIYLEAVGALIMPDTPNDQGGMMGDHTAAAAPEGRVPHPADYVNATVRVTPDDVQKLTLVSQRTKLSLALRPEGDTAKLPQSQTDLSAIIGLTSTPKPAPAPEPQKFIPVNAAPAVQPLPTQTVTKPVVLPPPPPVITVIRGTAPSQMQVTK